MAYLTKMFNLLPFSNNKNKSVYKTKVWSLKSTTASKLACHQYHNQLLHFATEETLSLGLIQENAMKLFIKPEILHCSLIQFNL